MTDAIQSILDNDLYKFSMANAILLRYPDTVVEYEFINRRTENKFNTEAVTYIVAQIAQMSDLRLSPEQKQQFKKACPFLSTAYLETLSNYRFDFNEVDVSLTKEGELKVKIKGLWWRTVLWEVPLMAIISQAYFLFVDKNWTPDGQEEKLAEKGQFLADHGLVYADFSTRRRRDYASQDRVVRVLHTYPGMVGTSNVHLALKYGIKPIGTMAHEWLMAHQVFDGILHSNRAALKVWQEVYGGDLGIALTDTLGTDTFFRDFDKVLSRQFDGVRHDSGPAKEFVDKTVAHYKAMRIDPLTKTIVFSDGLNCKEALEIAEYCKGKILFSSGIGTFFSNDYEGSKALNIVIKLRVVDGRPVVKLSDVITKAIGDRDALRVTRWVVNGTPLDDVPEYNGVTPTPAAFRQTAA